jgi:hypothetical protein
MNCLEFRRLLLTEPDTRDPEFLEHRRQCPSCARLATEQRTFERRLAQALAVPVPDDLVPRLILRRALRHQRRLRYALVAGVALALVAGLRLWWVPGAALEDLAVAHVEEEIEHLQARTELAPAQVAGIVRSLGARLDGALGAVRYAGVCRIGRHPGGHLVLAGATGPVTVLLLPHEPVAARSAFRRGAWHGVLVPADGGGLAVIGPADAPLDDIARRLETAIRWPAAG